MRTLSLANAKQLMYRPLRRKRHDPPRGGEQRSGLAESHARLLERVRSVERDRPCRYEMREPGSTPVGQKKSESCTDFVELENAIQAQNLTVRRESNPPPRNPHVGRTRNKPIRKSTPARTSGAGVPFDIQLVPTKTLVTASRL